MLARRATRTPAPSRAEYLFLLRELDLGASRLEKHLAPLHKDRTAEVKVQAELALVGDQSLNAHSAFGRNVMLVNVLLANIQRHYHIRIRLTPFVCRAVHLLRRCRCCRPAQSSYAGKDRARK